MAVMIGDSRAPLNEETGIKPKKFWIKEWIGYFKK
jgi:hypothetical protein